MLKNIVWSIITFFTILIINWGVAFSLNAEFIEYSFLTGLGVVVIVWFFNSTGGIGSNSVRVKTQAQTGIKVDEEKKSFNPTVAFYTAAVYTLISLILTIFYFKDYFIS
ncbi:hypothetical protein GH741_10605 [Aquibacillus halophilus]|uniref:DUF3899 domain-containing protein n=2 Tax=Aquibacillus halophilus TaxID=930132 RepID=A0A6A8DD18_9BACI|nr:hypothetical protein [Aquibacillus halophilus]